MSGSGSAIPTFNNLDNTSATTFAACPLVGSTSPGPEMRCVHVIAACFRIVLFFFFHPFCLFFSLFLLSFSFVLFVGWFEREGKDKRLFVVEVVDDAFSNKLDENVCLEIKRSKRLEGQRNPLGIRLFFSFP